MGGAVEITGNIGDIGDNPVDSVFGVQINEYIYYVIGIADAPAVASATLHHNFPIMLN